VATVGHVAVGLAAGRIWRGNAAPDRGALAKAMIAFSALSLAPDVDVLGFRFGIPYWTQFGHRGATHSIAAALLFASLATLAATLPPGRSRGQLWILCAAVAVSHGLLDSLTDGGLGIALFWPFTRHRYFSPWRPIPVAPIGLRMATRRGAIVTLIELFQFAPLWLWSLWPRRAK
jgi:inner membrane protein